MKNLGTSRCILAFMAFFLYALSFYIQSIYLGLFFYFTFWSCNLLNALGFSLSLLFLLGMPGQFIRTGFLSTFQKNFIQPSLFDSINIVSEPSCLTYLILILFLVVLSVGPFLLPCSCIILLEKGWRGKSFCAISMVILL